MSLSVAVIIATKGRPQEVARLLETLAVQTVPPDFVIVSACGPDDIEDSRAHPQNVEIMFGPPGLTAQRNRALGLIRGKYDIVIFFDDDFIPSRFWVERIALLFAAQVDVGTVTGWVLLDAVKDGGLPWSEGKVLVDKADSSTTMPTASNYGTRPNSPYGCNMAFRLKTIEGMTFDERLALSGWLEDLDFGLRAGTRGKIISTDFVWGVHLGVTNARASGLKFGYSQVVNPWYLMKKGIIKRLDAFKRISRGFAGNAIMVLAFQKSHVDRLGRLKGNITGIRDIIIGRWAPERISQL
jgi:glycosyltransferase involved in cell wall biosynthesis